MKKFTVFLFAAFIVLNAKSQITVNSLNNVGVGTSAPNEKLEISGNIRGNIAGGALQINTASNGYIQVGPQSATAATIYTDRTNFLFNHTVTSMLGDFASYYTADLIFKTGVSYYNVPGTVRMTITNDDGFVGIGTTTPGYLLDVNGVIRVQTTTYQSDERLKNNIQNVTGALTSLIGLQGKTYKLNPPATSTNDAVTVQSDTSMVQTAITVLDNAVYNRNHIGFLAQDIQKVFPELVYEDKEGMLSVDYISLIPVLVESLKEINLKLEALKKENELLKKKVGL
jgi:hypothetical protein